MRKSRKNPVLTSPWKIGMFVALMLAVTGAGVGFYFVHFYNIDLPWLGSDVSKWMDDSWSFFKETYPLVAGVVLISLMAYFMIATAVRRYKCYLSSGQDYRKMISLADSIDDLTNPAQIARLGDFPELQDILRSYGDQIKEISEEMGTREDERSVELEMEVESIIAGEEMREDVTEGKWWAPIVRKVNEHVRSVRDEMDGYRDSAEKGRRTSARAILSLGVVMESLGASNEDIVAIARSLGSLDSVISQLESGPGGAAASSAGRVPEGALSDSVEVLRKGSSVLHELAEENNGLALNIALMAARGDVSEHDLAQFAEKVRSTAERFNRLSTELSETAGRIAGAAGAAGASAGCAAGELESLRKISKEIDARNQSLQKRLTVIGQDMDSLHQELQDTASGAGTPHAGEDIEEERIGSGSTDDEALVNFAGGVESEKVEEEELVLDRSDVWEAPGLSTDDEGPSQDGPAVDLEVEGLAPGSGLISLEEQPDASVSFEAETAPEQVEEAAESAEAQSPAADAGEDMMEMPGHKWVKVDMEEPGEAPEAEEAAQSPSDDVMTDAEADEVMELDPSAEVRTDAEDPNDSSPEQFMERVADTIRGVAEMEEKAGAEPEQAEAGEEEPVYDLFELGATVYAEDTPGA